MAEMAILSNATAADPLSICRQTATYHLDPHITLCPTTTSQPFQKAQSLVWIRPFLLMLSKTPTQLPVTAWALSPIWVFALLLLKRSLPKNLTHYSETTHGAMHYRTLMKWCLHTRVQQLIRRLLTLGQYTVVLKLRQRLLQQLRLPQPRRLVRRRGWRPRRFTRLMESRHK